MHHQSMEQKRPREENLKELLAEAEYFKRLAFWGILVCTGKINYSHFDGLPQFEVATLTASICVPMLYSYAQYVQSSLRDELGFCAHRTRNLFNEFDKVDTKLIWQIYKFN